MSNNSESAKCHCQFYFPVYSGKQINKDFLVLHVQFKTVYQLYTSFSSWKCIRYDNDIKLIGSNVKQCNLSITEKLGKSLLSITWRFNLYCFCERFHCTINEVVLNVASHRETQCYFSKCLLVKATKNNYNLLIIHKTQMKLY